MGTMNASSFQISSGASNYDEVSMHQSLQFSDCLKYLHGGYSVTEMDGESSCWINYLRSESFQGFTSSQDLKNLRTQLYSAAEYFELSYSNDDQKQIVVETLRDYAIKALVNTVDHLGSMTYKVNNILDEKVDEVSGTEFQVSFIEQRLRTCRDFMDREGLSQQSLMINTPKFHKRYILPGEAVNGSDGTKIKYGCCLDDEDDWQQFKNAIRMTIRDSPASNSVRGTRDGLPSPSPRPPSQGSETFHFTFTTSRKELDKRTVSPNRSPLVRTGSLASREVTPKTSRPTTPNLIWHPAPSFSFPGGQQYPLEPWISSSMRLLAGREKGTETEHPSKSKRLLKALLSRRKSKKDETLYTYLDEY